MKRFCVPAVFMVTLISLVGCVSNPSHQTQKPVTSIAFSPDNKLLAFANAHQIEVIEVGSRKHVRTLGEVSQPTEEADPLLFRNGVGDNMVFLDNARIASTGMGGLVTIWDVYSGRRLAVIDQMAEGEYASTIDFSGATDRLLIGTSAGQILLATIHEHDAGPLESITTDVGYVWDLQFGRDGRYFASASLMPSNSPGYKSWAEPTGEPADVFAQAQAGAEPYGEPADAFAQAQVNMSSPSNVVIWDAEEQGMVGELDGATGVLRMALVPDQTALLTIGTNVAVWQFLTQEQSEEVSDPSMALQSIGVGTLVVLSVASMGMGGLPNMSFGEAFLNVLPIIPMPTSIDHGCARAVAISPDGRTIVSTTRGPTHNVMAVIDRTTNQVVEKWTAERSVCDLEFTPDGKHLVAATSRGVFIFDTESWKKANLEDLVLAGAGDTTIQKPGDG